MIQFFHGRSLAAHPADSLRRKVLAVLPDVKTERTGGASMSVHSHLQWCPEAPGRLRLIGSLPMATA